MPQSKKVFWQTYAKRFKYKHLSQFDKKVWEAFIDHHPDYFEAVAYDVPVGKGRVVQDVPDIKFQKMARDLTQNRIDVLGRKGDQLHICEIKPFFRPGACGQLLTYEQLFLSTYPTTSKIILSVIYFTATGDSFSVADALNIKTIAAKLPA